MKTVKFELTKERSIPCADQAKPERQTWIGSIPITLKGSGVTVNCLHPATLMNTRMVIESGFKPLSSVEEGADAILHVATSPDLEGQAGIYLDGKRPERANAQAYDTAARERLRTLSIRLTNLPAGE